MHIKSENLTSLEDKNLRISGDVTIGRTNCDVIIIIGFSGKSRPELFISFDYFITIKMKHFADFNRVKSISVEVFDNSVG